MAAAVFCLNIAGTAVSKFVLAPALVPSLMGYAEKADKMLHPKIEPTGKTNGLTQLAIRSLLSNIRIDTHTNFWSAFLFIDVKIDQSVQFFDDEESAF